MVHGFLVIETRSPCFSRSLLAQSGAFTAEQASLLRTAQFLFIFEQIVIFPLYYLPGLRGLLGGDGKSAKSRRAGLLFKLGGTES